LAARQHIVVVGSLNFDLEVDCSRLPVAGETVLGGTFRTVAGGKGANQAVAAARVGAKVSMFGCVGQDKYGRELLASLRADRVDVRRVRRVSEPTGVALIVVEHGGENLIVVAPGANACFSPADIVGRAAALRPCQRGRWPVGDPTRDGRRRRRYRATGRREIHAECRPGAHRPGCCAAACRHRVTASARERALEKVARLARQPRDLVSFWTLCWYTLDPASLLITSHFHEGLPEFPAEWLVNEWRARRRGSALCTNQPTATRRRAGAGTRT
jgi:hypothetical protein